MFIELTDAVTGEKYMINKANVRIIRKTDSGGTHLIFGSDMGRVVTEPYEAVKSIMDVIAVPALPQSVEQPELPVQPVGQ